MGKYVWNVATKADCLWVKWVDHVYMKGSDWWSYSPSISESWYWRAICALKVRLTTGYRGHSWRANQRGLYSVSSGYKLEV